MKFYFWMFLIGAMNSQLIHCMHLNQLNLDQLVHLNQTYLKGLNLKTVHSNLKRVKRSIDLRSRNKGIRSCYCKLRSSSFPVTINEEKLDFVCNCKRDQSTLFKHKNTEDTYLPTSSIRASSYRPKNYRTRNREIYRKHYPFEYERQRRRKKARYRSPYFSNSAYPNIFNDNEEQLETIKEPVKEFDLSNQTNQNEHPIKHFNEMVCSCSSNECTGNCDHLSGCVCNNKNMCWGNSCRITLSSLNMNLNPQLDSAVNPHLNLLLNSQLNQNEHFNKVPPSDLTDLIYPMKNKRIKKFKNVNEIYGSAESSLMSRINLNRDLDRSFQSFFQPIHPVLHHMIDTPISQAQPFIVQPTSRITFKTMILNEIENSNQLNEGVCNCRLNGRCSGLNECNNLKGCLCDTVNCYGRYCNLIKHFNNEKFQYQQNQMLNENIIRPIEQQGYEFRTVPSKVKYNHHHHVSNSLYDDLQDKQQTVNDLSQTFNKELPIKELAKESKTIKCEKIIDESINKEQQNKTLPFKVRTNMNDEKSLLNAYEMKVVKLTPVSSLQYTDTQNKDNTITLSNNEFQNRIDHKVKDNVN